MLVWVDAARYCKINTGVALLADNVLLSLNAAIPRNHPGEEVQVSKNGKEDVHLPILVNRILKQGTSDNIPEMWFAWRNMRHASSSLHCHKNIRE
jgi:hypothetical protein